jgi:sugar/nucleoside kinase (ribokinase family)
MKQSGHEFLILGSVAWDEIVRLDNPLRTGSHNDGKAAGGRIGGGAANTAMALARMGENARVISAVGEDEAGHALVSTLGELGVEIDDIDRHAGATTRSLVLLDANGERTVVNLARAAVPVPEELSKDDGRWLYVRSGDAALTGTLRQRLSSGGRVLAHVPPLEPGFRPASVLVGSASDLSDRFLAGPYEAGLSIAGPGLEWTVVTDGAGGAKAYGPRDHVEMAAPRVKVVDSTGAGDVFAAGLLCAMERVEPMQQALANAVAWGSASVTYSGTLPPSDFSRRVHRCRASMKSAKPL